MGGRLLRAGAVLAVLIPGCQPDSGDKAPPPGIAVPNPPPFGPPGTLDPVFGMMGVVTVTGGNQASAEAVARALGHIVVAGYDNAAGPGDRQWRIEKRNLFSGATDPGFGGGLGYVNSNPSVHVDDPRGVAVDIVSDEIFVAGNEGVGVFPEVAWRVEKRSLATGAPAAAFGGGGAVTSNPSGDLDSVAALALDSTSIYVLGSDATLSQSDAQWRIEKRDRLTGAPDSVFGAGTGVVTANPSTIQDWPRALAVDGGALYVVGMQGVSGNFKWRIEKRDSTTGAFDPVFGGGAGFVVSNPGPGHAEALAVALDLSWLYVVGYQNATGGSDTAWRIEKRGLITGDLDPAFGGGTGAVISNPSPSTDYPGKTFALDRGFLLVAGFDQGPGTGDHQWRLERRRSADGALDPTFGTAGVVTSNPGPVEDQAKAVAVDETHIYVVGHESQTGPGVTRWRIEKRAR